MSKFKVGDKVRRIAQSVSWCPLGYEATVLTGYEYEDVLGSKAFIHDPQWELVEYTSNYHKHHDLIIQWAKGAEIEYYSTAFERWGLDTTPSWKGVSYRIKPNPPKTDKERIAELEDRVQELENR